MKLFHRPWLLAGLAFVLVYLLPLGLRPLFIPDEIRYGEIAREMVKGGDWVVPHFNGLLYFEKPIFGYWAHAVSQLLLGQSNFAVRLPSALAIGLSALLLVVQCRLPARSAKGARLGALAALIFLTSIAVAGIGTFAVLDNLLTLFLTLTLVAFFRATEAQAGGGKERLWLLLAGLGCGLAFLTKGFLALVVPVIVAIPYLLWQRRGRELVRMLAWPLGMAILVSLPWALLVHQRSPDFWNFFFWHEHVKRFLSDDAQHAQPAYFFLALLPAMLLPWSFQFGSLWQGARLRVERSAPEIAQLRYLLCWLLFPLLFFSASRGKLMTYILPCFPAIAGLAAIWLDRYLATSKRRSFNVGALLGCSFFGLLLIALLAGQLIGLKGEPLFASRLPWVGGSLALGLTLLGFVLSYRSVQPWLKLLLFALAPIPFFAFAPKLMPEVTLTKKAPESFFTELAPSIHQDDLLLADGNIAGAVNWSLQREDVYLFRNTGELEYGASQPTAQGRFLTLEDAARLISEHPGKVVIFSKARQYQEWAQTLPAPSSLRQNDPQGFVVVRY